MARQCSICSHAERKAIESAHIKNESNRRIAAQFHVVESSLRRHFASHNTDPLQSTQSHPSPDRTRAMKRRPGENIPDSIKPDIQNAFLRTFVTCANETGACRSVQIDRNTVRYWEEHDETFSMRYQDAKEQVNDAIRAEIHRRGVLGYEDTLMTALGETVTVTKYSDRLVEFWAKARMREFREKTQMDIVTNGQAIPDPYEAIRAIIASRATRYTTGTGERANDTGVDRE